MSWFTPAGIRWTFAFAVVGIIGCSTKKGPDRKPVFPARGKLLVDNQPAAGALVALQPAGGSANAERPSATVGADGTFELTTYEAKDGAPAGDYVVTAEWHVSANKDAPGPWPNVIPEKYSNPATSDLRVRINEGTNELEPILIKR